MDAFDRAVRRVPGDLRKETKVEVSVIELPEDRLGGAADLLTPPSSPTSTTTSP